MDAKNLTLREWINAWDAGEFRGNDFSTQCKAGWYDWFCSDKSLGRRLVAMASKVKIITKSDKINPDTMYVFFKNNCPMWTSGTYDDFRICDIETGKVIFTIIPKFPKFVKEGRDDFHSECKIVSEVYSAEAGKTVLSGTWKDVLDYFGV